MEKLAREEKLRDIPGFGEKSEQNILKASETVQESFRLGTRSDQRRPTSKRNASTEFIKQSSAIRWNQSQLPVRSVAAVRPSAISTFSHDETGKDKQKNIDAVAEHILRISRESCKSSRTAKTKSASCSKAACRWISASSTKNNFGAALLYFTGSKEHNVALRGRANDMGWTLNEYALTTIKAGKAHRRKNRRGNLRQAQASLTSSPNCAKCVAKWKRPKQGKLPTLVKLADIRGDLQMHTTASDGKNTIEEMGEAARALGYEYIAHHGPFESRHRRKWNGRKAYARATSKRFAPLKRASPASVCWRASK